MNSGQNDPPTLHTRWNLIREVQGADEAARHAALEELCRVYRKVVITALIGKHGFRHQDAEDVAQAFLADLLRQRAFERADAAQGRFRSFLFTLLDRFVSHDRRERRALKRGGGMQPVPMEELQSPSGSLPLPDYQPSPAEELDRAWARATLKEALHTLRDEYRAAGKADEFVQFSRMLDRDSHAAGYEEIAQEMGLTAENLRQRVSRFKKEVRAAMKSVVRQTVGTEADLDEEFGYLWHCLN